MRFAFPIVDSQPLAASRPNRAPGASQRGPAAVYATHAAIALGNARDRQNLNEALRTRAAGLHSMAGLDLVPMVMSHQRFGWDETTEGQLALVRRLLGWAP